MKRSVLGTSLVLGLVMSSVSAQDRPLPDGHAALLIVEDGDDGERLWRKEHHPTPRYPPTMAKAGTGGCVAIGFFIEPDGTTSGHRILKGASMPARSMKQDSNSQVIDQLAEAAINALQDWRFVSGVDNPERRRAFSYTDVTFSMQSESPRRPCKIDNLETFLLSATR